MTTETPDRLVLLLGEQEENDMVVARRALNQLGTVERLIWMHDGHRVLRYLSGGGVFSDRALWPLPTLVLLNKSLPGLSGFDVLQSIRAQPRWRHLPVVMLCDGVELEETRTLAALDAACCCKGANALELTEQLGDAMCNALRMAWLASLRSGAHSEATALSVASDISPPSAAVVEVK